jgi:CRP-like cAMP-binding protein
VTAALIGVAAVLAAGALTALTSLRGLDTAVPFADAFRILRAHSLFAQLPAPVLEGLARELTPRTVRAGETVIAQGQVGDRFYLIGSGELDVSIDGAYVGTLHPGDGFGEVALLRDVPRTATVVARTDGLLYGLEREPFLDALRPAI